MGQLSFALYVIALVFVAVALSFNRAAHRADTTAQASAYRTSFNVYAWLGLLFACVGTVFFIAA